MAAGCGRHFRGRRSGLSRGVELSWSEGSRDDREDEHDGIKPCCEDEGAQCEGEGVQERA